MANIAVQRIKREFKEVLKSEEVGCHTPQLMLPLYLCISLTGCMFVSDASLADSSMITELLARANCTKHGRLTSGY